jgi:osmotically inducible protein OsmC
VDLTVNAKVPGMSAEQFEAVAQNAKENCSISKSLNADITLNATLEA